VVLIVFVVFVVMASAIEVRGEDSENEETEYFCETVLGVEKRLGEVGREMNCVGMKCILGEDEIGCEERYEKNVNQFRKKMRKFECEM
jgi:hypothetical protein